MRRLRVDLVWFLFVRSACIVYTLFAESICVVAFLFWSLLILFVFRQCKHVSFVGFSVFITLAIEKAECARSLALSPPNCCPSIFHRNAHNNRQAAVEQQQQINKSVYNNNWQQHKMEWNGKKSRKLKMAFENISKMKCTTLNWKWPIATEDEMSFKPENRHLLIRSMAIMRCMC